MRLTFINRISFLSLSFITVFIMSSCGKAPKKPGFINGSSPRSGAGANGAVGFPVAVSLAAYKEFLYQPLVQVNCSGCHEEHPFHANLEDSHRYAVEKYIDPSSSTSARILFETPDESALLRRVASNHNCGADNCTKAFVQEAISFWMEDLEDAGWEIPKPNYPNTTPAIAFNGGKAVIVPYDPSLYLAAPASQATGTNTYAAIQMGDPDGPVAGYLGSRPGDNQNANSATAGVASFNFDVRVPGDYFLWLRVKLEDDDQSSFFVATNGGNPQPFALDATGEEWIWRTVNDANGDPATFANLQTGPLTVAVRQRAGGAKFNYVLLTPRDDANRAQFVTEYYDLEIDISKEAGVPAKIIATVWADIQSEDGVKVIGVESLRIDSAQALRIKTIRPLINGIFAEGHATFLGVDTVVGGSRDRDQQIISTGGATGTILLADWEKDKLSFSFDLIEAAN